MVGTGFGGEERVLMSGYRVTCEVCGRRYVPTRRQVLRVLERRERRFECIHCWLGRRWRGVLWLLASLLLVGALLCSLTGCCRNGAWGPGPGEDLPPPKGLNAQQKAEAKRIDDASRKAVRDAEERLRHLNPMGGG